MPKKNADRDFTETVRRYRLPGDYPRKCDREIQRLKGFSIAKATLDERRDLRDTFTVTMDSLTAKDFDDAYSLERRGDGFSLQVHIADVSEFVPPGSFIDREAFLRGNSYYQGPWVIPMLPEILSNELCSLKEGEDRLTMTVDMEIDSIGGIIGYTVFESIINVDKRIPYEIGNDMLKTGGTEYDSFLADSLALKNILYEKRMKNSSLDFDMPEYELVFEPGNYGVPADIRKRERGECERIVEEFMLLANQCIALLGEKQKCFLYRVHDKPPEDKVKNVTLVLKSIGITAPKRFTRKNIAGIQRSAKGQGNLINTLLIRSMSQAEYHGRNIGHYGLAFDHYTHFTSPIRRYADLTIHRLIKKNVLGRVVPGFVPDDDLVSAIARQATLQERTAMDAERYYFKLKSARFMERKRNKTFNCQVSGIMERGIFLLVPEYGAEGFVPAVSLQKMRYRFREDSGIFQRDGEKGDRIVMGSQFLATIMNINANRGFIDFSIERRVDS